MRRKEMPETATAFGIIMGEKWCVYRFPCGVTLNPPEYLLDSTGHVMLFEDKAQAENYLRGHGVVPATVHIEPYN